MFRKLISHVPFSPSLISELGFYAKRLKKEESTRRIGLILTVLALIVQSFVAFAPPESANAANAGDLVHGGFKDRNAMLNACKNDTQGFRKLLDHAHITCDQLAKAKQGEIHSRVKGKDAGWLSWNRTSRLGLQKGETMMTVGSQKIYVRPLAAFDVKNTTGNGSYYKAFVGTNSQGKEFAIMMACANILMKERPASNPDIRVCELATKKMITILQNQFADSKHSKDPKACENIPTPKKISVCVLATSQVTTIDESAFNAKLHSKNLDDCKPKPTPQPEPKPVPEPEPPAPKNISVCILATKQMTTIKETDFNAKLHSKDAKDCEVKPISVCILATQQMDTIKETEFNAKLHSKNPDDCKPKPTPKPAASCSSLIVKKISRTTAELQASARVLNGATVKSYTYIATDASGKEVLRTTVPSTATSHSIQHTFEDDGTYTIRVIVGTSVGDQAADACKGAFTVAPIERCPLNPGLPINDPDCQPCPANPDLWVKDENCSAKVIRHKQATNLITNTDAQTVIAKADHRIEYVLTVKNEGFAEATFTMEDELADVLEYATLFDRGGGTLNEQTKTLSWGEITLQPGEQQKRSYVVRLASIISPMSRGASDPTSYDCRMVNTFGNTVEIEVDCPTPKVIEQVVPELPKTGPTENMIFGGIILAIVTFFYLRSRQLDKEVRLVRREVTAGTI